MEKYKLKKSLQFGDETITELSFRDPVAGDIYHFSDKVTMKDLLELASNLSGYPPSILKNLKLSDAMKIAEMMGKFMGDGQ